MIRVSKEIHCDGCAWWESIDIDVTRDWPYFKAQGWTRKNGEHYCADCSKVSNKQQIVVIAVDVTCHT